MDKVKLVVFTALIVLGIASRLVDHAPNLTPIVGIALFAGSIAPRLGWIVPVSIFSISNCWLGHYDLVLTLVVYGSFVFPALIGRWAKTIFHAVGLSFLSAIFFFIVSNFTVWANSGMYDRSLYGLLDCYVLAIPFFRNSLTGAMLSSFTIFGCALIFSKVFTNRRYLLRPQQDKMGLI